MKLWLAYWSSRWQAATSDETVIDLVFGVFTSREKAVETVKSNMTPKEWEEFHKEFVYEEVNVDEYHSIPHI